ncbi:MAG: N-sulfoglucosamine sulfohydrolase [Rhodothermales bacterium]|jgi:N-sulfoglucosamine sulfohydrolase
MTARSIAFLLLAAVAPLIHAAERPNILWISIEDWSPDLSCCGTKGMHTPHVDKLARQGIRYETAFTTSPVCSTSRSAIMTGFHQNYIRANQHREHNKQALPRGIQTIPHRFKEAGYYTALMSWKTDCNFTPNTRSELFEGEDWSERKDGQPFFVRITFGGTHRSWHRDPQRPIDPKGVYYPDTPFVRRDWANGMKSAPCSSVSTTRGWLTTPSSSSLAITAAATFAASSFSTKAASASP